MFKFSKLQFNHAIIFKLELQNILEMRLQICFKKRWINSANLNESDRMSLK